MKKTILLMLVWLMAAVSGQAQVAPEVDAAYQRNSYTAADGTVINYRSLDPLNAQAGEKYPLVVFLHGSGERGDDNMSQLIHGGRVFADSATRAHYPAFVVIPQCPKDAFWAYPDGQGPYVPWRMQAPEQETPIMQALVELIEQYRQRPDVDVDRIYVSGLSMGGMATYDVVIRHPEMFACATPICGSVEPGRLAAAKRVPWHIYHGGRDKVVPTVSSRMAEAALKALDAEVVYVEFPEATHNSWTPAFADPAYMAWMFSHRRQ